MLQVEYRLKLGQDEYVLKAEVKDEKEFFETMSFYSSLPKAAPGGSTDLKLSFRTTTEGHKYYSLVSEKEKMEYKLGQNKEAQGGGLFPKGWAPLFQKDEAGQTQQSPAPAFGTQAPATHVAPTQQYQAPPTAAPAFGSAPMPVPQTVAAPPTAPAPQSATAPATAAPNPQVAAVASSVLSRFGIQNK